MMRRPSALYYEVLNYQPENLERLAQLFEVKVLPSPDHDTPDLLSNIDVLFAPLGYRVSDEKMSRCGRLKAIASNTTGVPHIDLDAAARRGIAVCALHDEQDFLETITPTAEHAIGLMLAAWRHLPGAMHAAAQGNWDRRPWSAPAMFSRMRLGIVGYGRLGRKVEAICLAMGMQVAWYDPNVPGGHPSILSLAERSDVMTLHAVANMDTAGIVSRDVLQSLPRGAMIINTARGELLDEDALLDLLEAGHLSCAGLDVLNGEYEPGFCERLRDSRIGKYAREHDNLILTPHIGGSTVDAWRETERRVIEKVARVIERSETTG